MARRPSREMRVDTKIWSSIVVLSLAAFTTPAMSQSTPRIFDSHAQLRTLGIEVARFGPSGGADLPEKCPRFGGDGMYDLSFSRAFLGKFTARGFSKLALCAAIASEIRYNPETGQHLPTFILADVKKMKKFGGEGDAGDTTDQLPLDVPDCFRRARPLSDCKLNYDMRSGKKLSQSQAKKLADVIALRLTGGGYVLYNEGPAGPEPSEDTVRLILKNSARSPDIRTAPRTK
jgi:hypothetical protein